MNGHVRAFDRAGFVPRRHFLDCLRNSYAQTSVTPCSLRALEGAPVSTPLDWDEVHRTNLHSRSYAQTSSASA